MQVLNFVAVNVSQGYEAFSYLMVTDCGSYFSCNATVLPVIGHALPDAALPISPRNGAAYATLQVCLGNARAIASAHARGFKVKQFGLVR